MMLAVVLVGLFLFVMVIKLFEGLLKLALIIILVILIVGSSAIFYQPSAPPAPVHDL